MTTYPEHERMALIDDQSQIIGEFIDWLEQESGYEICQMTNLNGGRYEPCREGATKLLARYFGIDLGAIEAEKRAMLDALRAPTGVGR